MRALHDLMKQTLALRGSDLHLQAGERPRVRLQGELVDLEGSEVLTAEALERTCFELLPTDGLTRLGSAGSVDVAHRDADGVSWRCHAYQQRTGLALALRPLAPRAPTLADLNLPPGVARIAGLAEGLVLVTGASGSGRTSTLAAIVERINATRARHIITIEDPIEYVHQDDRSLIEQRAVGLHVASVHQGVTDSHHEDPDVVVIGEVRDRETVRAALTVAEAGALVLGTLPGLDAAQAVERVLDLFDDDERPLARRMLSHSLRAVVSQVLLPERTGKGRVPACEVLFQRPATAGPIRGDEVHELLAVIQAGSAEGMARLDDAISALVREGRVAAHEAAHERPWFEAPGPQGA